MKTRVKIILSAVLVVGLLVNAAVFHAQASNGLADFHLYIALNSDQDGIDMKCDKGCGWTSLSFNCGGRSECSSWIDASGMTGEE